MDDSTGLTPEVFLIPVSNNLMHQESNFIPATKCFAMRAEKCLESNMGHGAILEKSVYGRVQQLSKQKLFCLQTLPHIYRSIRATCAVVLGNITGVNLKCVEPCIIMWDSTNLTGLSSEHKPTRGEDGAHHEEGQTPRQCLIGHLPACEGEMRRSAGREVPGTILGTGSCNQGSRREGSVRQNGILHLYGSL